MANKFVPIKQKTADYQLVKRNSFLFSSRVFTVVSLVLLGNTDGNTRALCINII